MMPPPSAPLTDDGQGGGDLPLHLARRGVADLHLPGDHPFVAALEWTDTHQHLWDLDKFNLPCVRARTVAWLYCAAATVRLRLYRSSRSAHAAQVH
jgi:hypothetical protein